MATPTISAPKTAVATRATDTAFAGFSVFPYEVSRFDAARLVIGGNGVAIVAKGITDDAGATELVGAVVTIIGFVWSWLTHKSA